MKAKKDGKNENKSNRNKRAAVGYTTRSNSVCAGCECTGESGKELSPSLISSVRNEEVLSTKSVQDERDIAETIRISGEDYYEIRGTLLSVTVKHAWNTVEAKNILGHVLFSLTASGWFHYNPGVEVIYVADDSSAYANTLYGWSVESFSSSAS